MTDRSPLTVAAVRAMVPGDQLWDHVVTGLHIRARATKKSWHVYYVTNDGHRRAPAIGTFPTFPLERAREIARDMLERVAKGEDPSAARQEARDAPTVADLCAEWEKRKAPPVKKPRSFAEDQYNIRNHVLPRFGKLRVRDVTSGDLKGPLEAIQRGWTATTKSGKPVQRGGNSAARSVRTLLSGLFTLAEHRELGWRPKNSNPVEDVPEPKVGMRRVFVKPDQFTQLADALEALRPEWPEHVACIWVALYCGTRITELATARRDFIHGGLLILDEHKTDATGNERVIRLPVVALEEITRLPIHDSGYVFGALGAMNASPDGRQKDSARRSIHYVFEKARDAAGCPEIRPQDLRRTFASIAKSKGVSLSAIGELFSHADTNTTKRYAWLYDDAAGATANDVAEEIQRLSGRDKA